MPLARFAAKPAPVAEEVCEICAAPIATEHGHLVDLRDRRLLCACRPCFLLFVPQGAASGRYRAVGDRYVHLAQNAFAPARWEALQIPIGLAFFFFNSDLNRISAFYPGPAGATQSELSLDAWDSLAGDEPVLATMVADVEATLVFQHKDGTLEAYLVPIDACYELVGIVRTTWKGFEGGDDAHNRIDEFFSRIRERCR